MRIGFFGAGKMAEGILQAIEDKDSVIMAEQNPVRADEIAKRYGVAVSNDLRRVATTAEIIFLAVRPQDVQTVADAVGKVLSKDTTLVSIVAGKTGSALRKAFGDKCGIIRVMPNLALRAGAGMCAIAPMRGAKPSAVREVERILGGAGATVRLPEKHFDAVTALSGSGPAYFAYMEQAMAAGGVALGLKPKVARLLAEQTMYGTAKFLRESAMDLQKFIAGVSTKGGTTAAGMEELSNPQFSKIVAATLAAAARRSKELA